MKYERCLINIKRLERENKWLDVTNSLSQRQSKTWAEPTPSPSEPERLSEISSRTMALGKGSIFSFPGQMREEQALPSDKR
jgi:hypothetical protein